LRQAARRGAKGRSQKRGAKERRKGRSEEGCCWARGHFTSLVSGSPCVGIAHRGPTECANNLPFLRSVQLDLSLFAN